ncbi:MULTISPECIES: acylphosphatase [Shewanella]|uniref:acylphosphatase n=1 Tax=Shewanella fidelis TaxID=173509 RepID=A0AAW8NR05_9GAMM|nr:MULTISPECIES: acylphosphatase [Shewanella]MDR8524299.1 acylphosphatase [Shewanella fidelis]MDW4813492.1 acylphosphatase [Shewanella fidelis]MDW4817585.1 acylphosphatase [Shewanella fidelis]MDW4821652.1 acylphosphatase [Shewanella fidelis]MDW4825817.1 acylphosphatase [Shewanella fidelis]
MKRVVIKVKGKVQGVSYRQHTLKQATALGLTGFVSNLSDGSVQILAQGGEPAVDRLINWCYIGSPASNVDDVFVDEDEADEIYLDFSIIQL